MKILIDFFPILLFFAAYKIYDIYVATTVLMVGTVMQMSLIYAIDRKLQTLHKVTLLMVLGFGTLTLALHDERFVKWKPTVIWAAIGIGLAYAIWVRKTNFLKPLLSSQLDLPDFVWRNLSISWVPFCAFMSLINAYVVINYSTEAWVNFKLWGYLFWPVFLVGQGIYMSRHLKADEPSP